jgi:hypothetical protein
LATPEIRALGQFLKALKLVANFNGFFNLGTRTQWKSTYIDQAVTSMRKKTKVSGNIRYRMAEARHFKHLTTGQGCQIILETIYQIAIKYFKWQ